MKKYILRACGLIMAASSLTFTSCSLKEEVFSEITEDSFIPTDQDVAALLASAYSPLTYIYDWQGLFDVQEESGDVIITPTRPNGWDDGGTYRDMHKHQWSNMSWQPWNAYLTPYTGINNANRVMDQIKNGELPTGDLTESTLAELRAIRALWYSMLLDTHGNVPIVTAYTDEIPKQATRREVFDFVVNELKAVLPNLNDANDATTYGRMNKWAALACLERVYLNAKVYIGEEKYEEALDCANQIISSGIFGLAPDFSDNFAEKADYTNKECIFAVVYDQQYAGFGQQHKWYPPVARSHFGNQADYFWGGSCANPQFINAYEEGDLRKEKTWLIGPQYSASDPTVVVWTCLNYLPSLTCMKDGKNYTNIDYGCRVGKFEYNYDTQTGSWGNDFPYFRYAETLLTKAECLLRLGKNKEEAARIVTELRQRVFTDKTKATVTVADLEGDTKIKYGTLDWDNNIENPGDQTPVVLGGLYDEWGFEFACEAQRRTQMIRFGTFSTKNWFNHEAIPDGHTALFPIPLEEIQANSNLKQNPGY